MVGIGGALIGTYIGGFLGSISQLTWVTELSTPFVNLRALMSIHKTTGNLVYVVNGLLMTVVFYVVRVFFYNYMIFWKIHDFCFYRHLHFWSTYPEHFHFWAKLAIVMYFLMYCLQLFWFSKILFGLLKALGFDKAIEATERRRIQAVEKKDN